MSVQVGRYSRLRFGDLGIIDGVEFWDVLDLPDLPDQVDDLSYQVQGGDRIDQLATRFYGDPVLWWVIAAANDFELLPTALNEGDIIRIPAPRFVLQELFNDAKGR